MSTTDTAPGATGPDGTTVLPAGRTPTTVLPAGRTPTSAPPAAPAAVLVAVLLLAAGGVAVRDALVSAGALDGTLLTTRLARGVDGTRPQTWMLPAGVLAALVGLWFVVAALRPRRRTELAARSAAGVWLRPGDVARLASRTASDVPGVLSATSTASRRRIAVTVQTPAADTTDVTALVTTAVGERLAVLEDGPRLQVRARSTGGAR